MDLEQYQMQMVVCSILILVAAIIALLVDYLKRSNDKLREINLELRIRKEEAERRMKQEAERPMTPEAGRALSQEAARHTTEDAPQRKSQPVPVQPAIAAAAATPAESTALVLATTAIASAPAPAAAIATASTTAADSARESRRARREARARLHANPDGTQKRPPSPAAIAAMEKGARLAERGVEQGTEQGAKMAELRSNPLGVPEPPLGLSAADRIVQTSGALLPVKPSAKRIEVPAPTQQPVSAPDPTSVPETSAPLSVSPANAAPAAANARNWSALLASRRTAGSPVLPRGFHEHSVLTSLLAQRVPVSGVVMSLSIDGVACKLDLAQQREMIAGLTDPADFAASAGQNEFVLVLAEQRGIPAQRQMNQVAQKLWALQLHSMETTPVTVGWGGVEAHNEPLDSAIEAARERMDQTRRNRRVVTMESRVPQPVLLRQAV